MFPPRHTPLRYDKNGAVDDCYLSQGRTLSRIVLLTRSPTECYENPDTEYAHPRDLKQLASTLMESMSTHDTNDRCFGESTVLGLLQRR
jgi:hypothetical protein